jgi:lysozyme family protein
VWETDPQARGSQVIAALQARLRMPARKRDGMIGPATIRALQRYLGTPADGVLSRESKAIKALQRRLNEGDL